MSKQVGGKHFLQAVDDSKDPNLKSLFYNMNNDQIKDSEINRLCGTDPECHETTREILNLVKNRFRTIYEGNFMTNNTVPTAISGNSYENEETIRTNSKTNMTLGVASGSTNPNYVAGDYDPNARVDSNAPNNVGNVMNDDHERKKFQESARKYIQSLSPSHQILELQNLQRKVPFVLADPGRRLFRGGGDPKYGPQDMYYFLSDHFAREMNHSKNFGEDPFYKPMIYPDDASMDQVLHHLLQETPFTKFMRLYDQYKHNRTNPEVYAKRIKQIYKTLMDKNHVANPFYLTKFVTDQERPMEQYRNQEFMSTLSRFTDKYASVPKPTIRKVKINVPHYVDSKSKLSKKSKSKSRRHVSGGDLDEDDDEQEYNDNEELSELGGAPADLDSVSGGELTDKQRKEALEALSDGGMSDAESVGGMSDAESLADYH